MEKNTERKQPEAPLLAEHDSWLAFDPIRGCANDCGYCFLRLERLTRRAGVMTQLSVAELAERYTAYIRDIPPSVPVSFGNATDLLSSKRLFAFFCELSAEIRRRDPKRLFIVISKARITPEMARRISDATGGSCLIFLSQSYAQTSCSGVERGKVSTPEETLESARCISETEGLKCAHFWRPFLSRWNPPELLSDRVRALKDSGCSCSVIIGLKATRLLKDSFSALLLAEAEGELSGKALSGDEYLCSELADRAIAAGAEHDYPIYRHTSCAIAFAEAAPDINGTAYSAASETRCRGVNCPIRQRAVCFADCPQEENAAYIARCREQYGEELQIRGNRVWLDAPVTDDAYNHLLHVFRRAPVVSQVIRNKVWRGSVNDTE